MYDRERDYQRSRYPNDEEDEYHRYEPRYRRDYSPNRRYSSSRPSHHSGRERDPYHNDRMGERGGDLHQKEAHLMDYKEYANSLRKVELTEEEVEKRYDVYRNSFIKSWNEKYFKANSSEEWYFDFKKVLNWNYLGTFWN